MTQQTLSSILFPFFTFPQLLQNASHNPFYYQLKLNNIANSQMSYFQRHQKHSQNSFASQQQNLPEENNNTAEFKKNSESKQSYLKAFKKYYIDKLLQNKLGGSDIQTRSNQENVSVNKVQSHHENETKSVYRKETKSIEKEKSSVMTDCTRKSKEKSTPNKISRINNNDSQLEEMLYSSITEMEREILTYGDVNDLARENKLLKCSISKLKQILKDKLLIALKKNKEELTLMFDQYSNMIKKLLEDKETLTNQLENERSKYTNEQKRWNKIEEEYENQIRSIGEENATQITQTKQQIEQFLDMIIQYQEEANAEKLQVQKLRQKVVELEMENDRLKNEITSERDTKKYISFSHNEQEEEQLQKYALKIESLLTMLEELQNQNEELNLFLKSCKCSRIELHKTSNDSLSSNENAKQIAKKYERQLIQAEKQYLKEQTYLREVLKRKDECIDRLNLVIEQLRKARYASVDRMTEDALKKQISQIMR